MKQLILTTIILSVIWGCSSHTNEKKVTKQGMSNFENYVSTLDHIPIPLKSNPLARLPESSKNFDKNAFEKYKHAWTSQPLGIYYKDEKTVGIIDCSIGDWGLVPFLTTYDLEGNKIDSTRFYEKSGQDIGYEATEHVTFNTDRTITVLDTVKLWDLNEDETDIVQGSMKITTGKVEYRVLENGRIEKK